MIIVNISKVYQNQHSRSGRNRSLQLIQLSNKVIHVIVMITMHQKMYGTVADRGSPYRRRSQKYGSQYGTFRPNLPNGEKAIVVDVAHLKH